MKKILALLLAALLMLTMSVSVFATETDTTENSDETTPDDSGADAWGTIKEEIDYGDTVIGYDPNSVITQDLSEIVPLSALLSFPGQTVFKIGTPAELALLATYVNSGVNFNECTIFLANDLDMTGIEMKPIGITPTGYGTNWQAKDFPRFCGTFDGQGHTIDNLVITSNASSADNECFAIVGLFGSTGSATIKNLIVGDGCSFSYTGTAKNAFVGGIVAVADRLAKLLPDNQQDPNAVTKIINCYSAATVTSTKTAAGIVAWTESNSKFPNEITNCTSAGKVTGKNVAAGILAYCGASRTAKIENCRNTGEVVLEAALIVKGDDINPNNGVNETDIMGVGGILGLPTNSGGYEFYIRNCINNGTIAGPGNVGGILGVYNAYWMELSGCSNYGNINIMASNTNYGGIFGKCNYGSDYNHQIGKAAYNADLRQTEYADETVPTVTIPETFPNYEEVKAAQDAWVAEKTGSSGGNNNSGGNTDNGNTDNGNNNSDSTTQDSSDDTTGAPTVDSTPATSEMPAEEKKGGCGSVAGSMAVLFLLMGGAAMVVNKKKND
ncbi:MAG: hypothetical protein IKC59_03645 [Clostridia bacterium]|nr:hypothetical protein [Clostridia bacterium]